MKKYFLTGFATLLPLALTLMIALWVFNLFTAPLAGITEKIILSYEKQAHLSPEHHATIVFILSRILALIVLLSVIFLLGICGQKFVMHIFVKFPEKLFSKIPFVGSIFRLSKEMTNALFSENKKTFRETILLPFPHHEAFSIGFVTSDTPLALKKGAPDTDLVVFVPTAPHPISGYLLLIPKSLAHHVDISVEDAFKFLISCGVIHPKNSPVNEK